MAKIQELNSGGDIKLVEAAMGIREPEGVFTQRGDVYVVDMESLVHVSDKDLSELKLQRTLSRNLSQRVEWKPMAERASLDATAGIHGGVCTMEGVPLLAIASLESNGSTTSTAAENRGRRFLRSSSIHPKRSYWLDPRKVLFTFATMSSMGTIILIYFTLSVPNINSGDALV